MQYQLVIYIVPLLTSAIYSDAVSETSRLELRMPGFRPMVEDYYSCASFLTNKSEEYIVRYEALADGGIAHHILLYACDFPGSADAMWECSSPCESESNIMFAWAKNAPPTSLPADVGYHIGYSTDTPYLVLQIHYASPISEAEPADTSGIAIYTTPVRPTFVAGIFFLGSSDGVIPPHEQQVVINVSCVFNGSAPIYTFAFRTHAHALATVISGYKHNNDANDGWERLAKGNPQWPQAFYPMDAVHEIKPGERVVALCVYNSSASNDTTYMGPNHDDEMCNLYIMYYVNESNGQTFYSCTNDDRPQDYSPLVPADAVEPLPRNVTLESKAQGRHVLHPAGSMEQNSSDSKQVPSDATQRMEIRMPAIKPTKEDYIACKSEVVAEQYIVQYEVLLSASRSVQQIILYECEEPNNQSAWWECSMPCLGEEKMLFAWGSNASAFQLPAGAGNYIGSGHSTSSYLVMQVHYNGLLPENDSTDSSGIALSSMITRPQLVVDSFQLSAVIDDATTVNETGPYTEVFCSFVGTTRVQAIAMLINANSRATASVLHGDVHGNWKLIAKGNSQWNQLLYPLDGPHAIEPGDHLVAHCEYNGIHDLQKVATGTIHSSPSCTLHIMYYSDEAQDPFNLSECSTSDFQNETSSISYEPDISSLSPFDKLHSFENESEEHTPAGNDSHSLLEIAENLAENLPADELAAVENWPQPLGSRELGQVSGLITDKAGNVLVFHRSSVTWTANSFDSNNVYLQDPSEPIVGDVLLNLTADGEVASSWGGSMFFMPHGLAIDENNTIYITDVALHQVFAFPLNTASPSLVLGTSFVPGDSVEAFCQPSAIAVKSNGDFYVADGYCNSRVKSYSCTGELLMQWGSPGTGEGQFNLLHSLALSEQLGLLCVADRRNARVQCFDLDGTFVMQVAHPAFGSELFAVIFHPMNPDLMFAVNGDHDTSSKGFYINVAARAVIGQFTPQNESFGMAHVLAIAPDGHFLYAGQTEPPRIWKLDFMPNSNMATGESIDNTTLYATDIPENSNQSLYEAFNEGQVNETEQKTAEDMSNYYDGDIRDFINMTHSEMDDNERNKSLGNEDSAEATNMEDEKQEKANETSQGIADTTSHEGILGIQYDKENKTENNDSGILNIKEDQNAEGNNGKGVVDGKSEKRKRFLLIPIIFGSVFTSIVILITCTIFACKFWSKIKNGTIRKAACDTETSLLYSPLLIGEEDSACESESDDCGPEQPMVTSSSFDKKRRLLAMHNSHI